MVFGLVGQPKARCLGELGDWFVWVGLASMVLLVLGREGYSALRPTCVEFALIFSSGKLLKIKVYLQGFVQVLSPPKQFHSVNS